MSGHGGQFSNIPLSMSHMLSGGGGGGGVLGAYVGARAGMALHEHAANINTAHTMRLNEHTAGLNMQLAAHGHELGLQRAGVDHANVMEGKQFDARQARKSDKRAAKAETAKIYAKGEVDRGQTTLEAMAQQARHTHEAPERDAARGHEYNMQSARLSHEAGVHSANLQHQSATGEQQREHEGRLKQGQFQNDRDLAVLKGHTDVQSIKARGKEARKTLRARPSNTHE